MNEVARTFDLAIILIFIYAMSRLAARVLK